MTDEQLLEFAKNYRCSHPGLAPWVDITEEHFVNVARAIEQASRTAALEEAAIAAWSAGMDEYGQYSQLMDPRHVGSVCAKRIRALAKGESD